jgi:hypothetical protein
MRLFFQRNTVLVTCLIATAPLFTAPACANPEDYSFELVGVDESIAIVSLKNTVRKELVSDALINCSASVGPQDIVTMTEPMAAYPGARKGEYVLIGEPGMSFFDVDLVAEVPGETQPVTGKLHIKDQGAQ